MNAAHPTRAEGNAIPPAPAKEGEPDALPGLPLASVEGDAVPVLPAAITDLLDSVIGQYGTHALTISLTTSRS